jgi:hypothetical protein
MSTQSRPRASFGTTKKNIPGVLFRSRGMYNGFTANVALLGSPTITMAAFLALITALEQAQETATETKAKGSRWCATRSATPSGPRWRSCRSSRRASPTP